MLRDGERSTGVDGHPRSARSLTEKVQNMQKSQRHLHPATPNLPRLLQGWLGPAGLRAHAANVIIYELPSLAKRRDFP